MRFKYAFFYISFHNRRMLAMPIACLFFLSDFRSDFTLRFFAFIHLCSHSSPAICWICVFDWSITQMKYIHIFPYKLKLWQCLDIKFLFHSFGSLNNWTDTDNICVLVVIFRCACYLATDDQKTLSILFNAVVARVKSFYSHHYRITARLQRSYIEKSPSKYKRYNLELDKVVSVTLWLATCAISFCKKGNHVLFAFFENESDSHTKANKSTDIQTISHAQWQCQIQV